MLQHRSELPEVAPLTLTDEAPSPARIEAFSDGVFAIIITLLVLDIRVPREADLHGEELIGALLRQWPVYVAYVLSFLQVGVVWANHHTMFHYLRHSDHVLLFTNLILLLCVAILPFTTALMAEYARSDTNDLRIAALLYSAALCSAGVMFSFMWQHAQRARLVKLNVNTSRLYALTWHWRLVPLFYGLAFVLALVTPYLSVGIYILLLIYYAMPGPTVVRWTTGQREAWVAESASGDQRC
ncbi:TMEM175 family protein [Methylorubrum rhodesianum]|uniref:TMEM175 family protein n=1 Tax=Methylorubrum rhodesianum TaxID=29427 RepID=UPI003D2932B3